MKAIFLSVTYNMEQPIGSKPIALYIKTFFRAYRFSNQTSEIRECCRQFRLDSSGSSKVTV
ncbi:MAG TPA: hypothetical protein PKW69_09810, partial [Niabella sp.]|nr:hypothetical protein [Niabella sp.]